MIISKHSRKIWTVQLARAGQFLCRRPIQIDYENGFKSIRPAHRLHTQAALDKPRNHLMFQGGCYSVRHVSA